MHGPTKEELLEEGLSLERRLMSEIQAARQVRIKWHDFRRIQLRPFEEKQDAILNQIHKYQHDFYTLLPSLPADVDTRNFETLWSRQRDYLKSLRHELSLALTDAKSEANDRVMRYLTIASLIVAVLAGWLVVVQIKMANDQDAIIKTQLSTTQAQHEVMKTQDTRLKDQTVMMGQQNKLLGEQVALMQRQLAIQEKQDLINTQLLSKKPHLLVEHKLSETLVAGSDGVEKPRYDLQFTIFNSGDKSTRNYAVYLFVPSSVDTVSNYAFTKAPEHIKIHDRDHYYFTLYVRDSVAPQQRVALGNLSFLGPLHELTIPWKIETEDGVIFPSNKEKLGQLTIPIKTHKVD